MATIRIAGVVRQSIVDGPGLRFTLFTQGCPHRCPGCHNPHTHSFDGGYGTSPETVLAEMDKNPLLKGITLSGGEPFSQAAALLPLAKRVREKGKDIWCYSGYTLEELMALSEEEPAVMELLSQIDVLVDGPFLQEQKDLTLPFRGSRNQRILDVQKSLQQGLPAELNLT